MLNSQILCDCWQARRRSRAAAILDATEEPRPGVPQREEGDIPELMSPLSTLLLSPLSSLDLSAEPLSPNTTAALQTLREQGFPRGAEDNRGAALDQGSPAAGGYGVLIVLWH